ncbi:hypothetical protein [Tepidibacillus fermentans]|uniref:ComK protein n=1 Tax=Tepidibacillus fermentans TaxID=1281767 RepID=A0A4V2USF6_9BACI|nr:hypothetical protein [Tepidibacillus fermentans]TCS81262.1 hypothetical protein EDD72_11320 [Tepidibacillus fermentans]
MKKNQFYPFMLKGSAFFAEPIQDRGLLLKVLYQDGTKEIFSTTAQSFLNQMIHFFGYDLVPLRKQYGQAIGKQQMVPLPLLEDWILIPLKLSNQPNGEFFTGWVVAQSMVHMEEENKSITKLFLEGNHMIYCGHRLSFCDQQIRHVALVQHRYRLLHGKGNLQLKEGRLSYFL